MFSLLFALQILGAAEIYPGETRVVRLPHAGAKDARVFCREVELPARRTEQVFEAFVAEPYVSKLEPFSCELRQEKKVLSEVAFRVKSKDYPVERLAVPARLVQLSPVDQERYDAEQATLRPVYAASSPSALFEEPFVRPLDNRITSPYGIRRVLNGVAKSEHNGVDFRAGVGTKIPAANAGRVVYTGQLMRSGKLVVLDHGLGVFTQYHHLSKILVNKGEIVTRGQTLGLAGATGRASGPHLHWAIRVQDQFVDGLSLIEATRDWSR